MTDEEFALRTPEVMESARVARAKRTDRQVLDEIESRLVRVETRVTDLMKNPPTRPVILARRVLGTKESLDSH